VNPGTDKVVVLGAGIMGSGIAQVAAIAGFEVELVETSSAALASAPDRIGDSLTRMARAGRITESPDEVLSRVHFRSTLEACADGAALVIEAVVENLEIKQSTFEALDARYPSETVLATNTSQFAIHRVGERCRDQARVVGMHWSNPPPVMTLVEVTPAEATSESTVQRTLAFIERCGKKSVVCRRDVPGFISNRLSTVLFMEGVRLVDEGIATVEDVDQVAIQMFGHRMGPLATLDLAGLDTALMVAEAMDAHYGGDRFSPPPLLGTLVAEGRHGRKTGRGFYDYA
jgi:3-hydroxybutyryl-CoA dehydrogenase